MSFKEFAKELNGNRVEGELIKTVLYSLITSAIVLIVLYFFKLGSIDSFVPRYGLFIFLAMLSYAVILPSIRQVRAYRELPCMSGMMVGMTTGMIAGFLSGFYIGATNGMFIGSIWGVFVGIGVGIWNGRCCGIMGAMEGSMAGFMGGFMGGMTALMLFSDHLRATAIIIFIISASILLGLHYLIYKDMRESEQQRKEDHFITISLSFFLILITTWLMVFGPRSSLFIS